MTELQIPIPSGRTAYDFMRENAIHVGKSITWDSIPNGMTAICLTDFTKAVVCTKPDQIKKFLHTPLTSRHPNIFYLMNNYAISNLIGDTEV